MIDIKMVHCPRSCSNSSLNIKILTRSSSDILPKLYHEFDFALVMKPGIELNYYEYLLMEQRFVSLSMLKCKCTVDVRITPFAQIMSQTRFQFEGKMSQESPTVKVFDNFDYLTMYDAMLLTWKEAQKKCENLGASLPVLTSEYHRNLIMRLLLGDTFVDGGKQRFVRTPCRQNHGPLCGTFIGLFKSEKKVRRCIFALF